MNWVFVNSFEKRVEESRVITAQVSIGERQGVWHVLWSEPDASGKPAQHVWFEGDRWQEMLRVFRMNLAEKTGEGYLPLIDTERMNVEGNLDKSTFALMMQHYSESHANEELYEQLRQWRREQASKEGKPSYLIATNRVLRMIACFVPHTMRELLTIPGFGENKCAKYGEAVTAITGNYPQAAPFPLDWVAEQTDDYAFRLWLHKQKQMKAKASLERREARETMLGLIIEGATLADAARAMNVPRREIVLWIEQLDGEGHDLEAFIDAELRQVPGDEQERAWRAFEQEGDKYLKPVLQKVYSEEELKTKNLEQAYEWLRLMRLRFRKQKGVKVKAS